MKPKMIFFDMDHTLVDCDCDVSWKDFLIDLGMAAPTERLEADRFFKQYQRGELDVGAFLDLQLRQFQNRTEEEMRALSERHFSERVMPVVYPEALEKVRQYQSAGTPTVLLTATNEVIATPVAEHFQFDGLLATRLEMKEGRYTGQIIPPYCIGPAKVDFAQGYCEKHEATLLQAGYYGDSVNDIPLLEAVGFPVAVNPTGKLETLADKKEWKIERWRLKGEKQ